MRKTGQPFVTATVVRVQPPTSGKPGDKALITQDGRISGWIGGSCVEPVVLREARAAFEDGQCRLVRLAPGSEEDRQGLFFHRMTCFSGGAMEVYIEPNLPLPRLLIFGTSPIAESLARLAEAARFEVLALKENDLQALQQDGSRESPCCSGGKVALAPSDYAVIATHGTFDDSALGYCLKRKPAYLGLLASRRRAAAIRKGLKKKGYSSDDLQRIQAPAGLDLNAKTPEEVAISILAQIVARRRSAQGPDASASPEKQEAVESSTTASSSSCCRDSD
ncbi:MAG TPA: XdhC family protein [Acidobacteriota bacterium]|nr:XdhC family protein [Acidobacteriota bacterium]